MSDIRNLIIIGSGPAGYTAALYAARARMRPLVFEGSVEQGGALMNTTDVENYPGFPEGIMGPDLMDAFRKQAERFDAELVPDDLERVDLTGDTKVVLDSAGTQHRARAVILAMGSGYRRLGIPGEDLLSGHGVSWCATCDGFFFRDQDIAVVGGGDSAMEEALFLTKLARSVTVIHRRDELRASKIVQDRAFANDKITFVWNTAVAEVLGSSPGGHRGRHGLFGSDRRRAVHPCARPLTRLLALRRTSWRRSCTGGAANGPRRPTTSPSGCSLPLPGPRMSCSMCPPDGYL